MKSESILPVTDAEVDAAWKSECLRSREGMRRALEAFAAGRAVPAGKYMDGVEVDRLAFALSWMGCRIPASREALAFSIPECVNDLTRAVADLKTKMATPAAATGAAL